VLLAEAAGGGQSEPTRTLYIPRSDRLDLDGE
jgi:hypothetical protein